MTICEIPFGSPHYEAAKALRETILRMPLGLTLTPQDVAGEDRQIHIVGARDGVVCGTVILKPGAEGVVKLRQMAVAADEQGSGLGRRIVAFAEDLAIARGFKTVELHARVSAQGFYVRAGYKVEGDGFTEIGLPHVTMVKRLGQDPPTSEK